MRYRKYLFALLALALFGCGGGGISTPFLLHIFVLDGSNDRLILFRNMAGLDWQTFGSAGSGVGQFNDPSGLAFDSLGRIYICDYFNNRIVRMDDVSGAGWVAFGTAGSGTNQFNNPYKIAIDSSDRIFVTDSGNDRIVRFDTMSGANWVAFGTSGGGVNQFDEPIGIAVSSGGQIYVTDWGNDRIVRIDDMTGSNWTTFGSSGSGVGQFESAVDIWLDGSNMYVCDRNSGIIQTGLMSTTGWTKLLCNSPQSVSTLGGRIFFVLQNDNCAVRVDDISGANQTGFGATGSGDLQFFNPNAIRALP